MAKTASKAPKTVSLESVAPARNSGLAPFWDRTRIMKLKHFTILGAIRQQQKGREPQLVATCVTTDGEQFATSMSLKNADNQQRAGLLEHFSKKGALPVGPARLAASEITSGPYAGKPYFYFTEDLLFAKGYELTPADAEKLNAKNKKGGRARR